MNKGLIKIQEQFKNNIIDYNNNPNKCLYCNGPILYIKGKLRDTKVKKFCNTSCAASHNNKIPKRKKLNQYSTCECGNTKGRYVEVCRACFLDKKDLGNKTIGELKAIYNNYFKFRIRIAKAARDIFKTITTKSCVNCGYDKHVQAAHIKSVASFSDDVLISEINNKKNLIPLCPNCHWEYDNGLLDLKDNIANWCNSNIQESLS
jgi:hypothetical protein